MGKTIGKVAKAAVIGAAVGAVIVGTGGLGGIVGGGAFLGVGGSIAAASGVGFAVTATSLAVVGAIGGAAIFGGLALVKSIAGSFVKKPNMDVSAASDAVDRLQMSVNPSAVSKLVFGDTAMGSDIIYAEKIDEDKVVYIIELAGHEIDSITGFYVNDESVSFSGNAATGDYAGILWRYVNLGTDSQTYLTGFSAAWPSSARGRGRAHMALVWDLKAGQEKLSGGVPTRITTIGNGALCYDPRLDTTVGGSGSHRADDPSTWEYSANWALIALTYILGWQTNSIVVIGKGDDPANIDYDSWIAAANICDETVDSKPRYRIGGLFSASNDHDNILSQLEAAIGGSISKISGKWYAWVPNDDLTSVGTITEADMVRSAGVHFSPAGDVRDLFNTGRGLYINPSLLYQTDFYPEVSESSAITEDGGLRVLDANYSIIQDVEIAERVTRFRVRRSRFSGTWTFAMTMKGLLYRPFSVVTINCRETNDEDVVVRVLNMSSDWKTGIVGMTVIEEDASIYDDTISLGTPVTQLDPGIYDPSAAVSVSGLGASDTAVTGDSGTAKNYLLVSWTDPGGFVSRTDIQYRVKTGPGATQNASPLQLDLTQSLVGPVEQTTVYEVRARHVTIFGVVGGWSSWVEETSGAADTAAAAAAAAAAALSQLADISADGKLTPDEKKDVDREYAALTDEQSGLDSQATAYGITTEKTTYDGKITSLTSYLSGLSPAWNDTSSTTTITRATWNTKWSDVYTSKQALLNKIAEVAGERANYSDVLDDDGTKPENNATQNVAGNLIHHKNFDAANWNLIEGTAASSFAGGAAGWDNSPSSPILVMDLSVVATSLEIFDKAFIPIGDGEGLYVKVVVARSGAANRDLSHYIAWYTADKSVIGTSSTAIITVAAAAPGGNNVTSNLSAIAPSGTAYARHVLLRTGLTAGAGEWHIGLPFVTRQADANGLKPDEGVNLEVTVPGEFNQKLDYTDTVARTINSTFSAETPSNPSDLYVDNHKAIISAFASLRWTTLASGWGGYVANFNWELRRRVDGGSWTTIHSGSGNIDALDSSYQDVVLFEKFEEFSPPDGIVEYAIRYQTVPDGGTYDWSGNSDDTNIQVEGIFYK